MQILQQTANWVAVMKPSGHHVHPPESSLFRIPRDKIVLYQLRRLMKKRVYPVHRLDVGTSGVLLMALHREGASYLGQQFQNRQVKKTYHTVVRGWLPDEGVIDRELALDSTGTMVPATTHYRCLDRFEIAKPVGKKHASARYSLLHVEPLTGRFHQIRRHMNRISHPVIGDATHGDSHHNRFFREEFGIQGLCLKAHRLEFTDLDGQPLVIDSPDDEKWTQIRQLFAEKI